MGASSKSKRQAVGAVLAVVGAGAIVWGYRDSQTIGAQFASAITGDPTNDVMLLYVLGGAALAAGLFLILRR